LPSSAPFFGELVDSAILAGKHEATAPHPG